MSVRQNGNLIAGSGVVRVPSINDITASASTTGLIFYSKDVKKYYVTKVNESVYSWEPLIGEDDLPTINTGTIDASGVVSITNKISGFKGVIIAPENVEPTSIPTGYSLETYESI